MGWERQWPFEKQTPTGFVLRHNYKFPALRCSINKTFTDLGTGKGWVPNIIPLLTRFCIRHHRFFVPCLLDIRKGGRCSLRHVSHRLPEPFHIAAEPSQPGAATGTEETTDPPIGGSIHTDAVG